MFLGLGVLASFMYCGVPMNGGSDSAWYYMNAHYLLTGHYIWESGYPSFTGPNQFFFPHGGYSLFMYVTRLLEGALGVSWIVMLRVIQLGAYLASAALVYAIGSRLKHSWAGFAGMICFFLYAPFLGYATTLLSESIATCLVLLVIWLFLKGILDNRKGLLCLCFFLGGYGVLLKPVLWLVVGLLAVTMVASQWPARRVGLWLLVLALTAVCPLAQCIENEVVFGNHRIRAGSGLNLWNRVIACDKSFPENSPEGQLIGDARVYDFPVKRGKWWLAATYFSRDRGYSKEKTEDVVSKIAWQGLMENKTRYAVGTATQAWHLLMADGYVFYSDLDPARPYGFPGPDQAEAQQLPLVKELVRQNDWSGHDVLGGLPANLYAHFARLFARAQERNVQVLIGWGYLGMLLAGAAGLRRRRDPEQLAMFAALLSPALVVVGSCLAEGPDQRFRLPAEPLLILACCIGIYALAVRACSLKRGSLLPGVSLRRMRAYACLAIVAVALTVFAGFNSVFSGSTPSHFDEGDACLIGGARALGRGDIPGALEYFNSAIRINPRSAEAYFNRGTAFLDKRDLGQAIKDYTKAIELEPDLSPAYLNRGLAHLNGGETDLALQDYTKVIELRPDYAEAYDNRGNVYLAQGDGNLAIRDYTKTIELDPNHVDAHYNRGIALVRRGDFSQGIEDYTKAIELRPDDVLAYSNRAGAYRRTGEYDKAWADVKKCRDLGGTPNSKMLELLVKESGRSE